MYPFLTVIVSFLIRSVPEIMSSPFPIGFDTMNYYVPALLDGRWSVADLTSPDPYCVVQLLTYQFLIHDPVLLVKVMGPLLNSALALAIYYYARRCLRWSPPKASCGAVLCTSYFVALRISWEMYRQMLGTIFLFLALVSMTYSAKLKQRIGTMTFALLTAVSHEIPGLILISVFVLKSATYLRHRSGHRALWLPIAAIVTLAILLYHRYVPGSGLVLPVSIQGEFRAPALDIVGFYLYCYWMVIPIALVGVKHVKEFALRVWVVVCLAGSLLVFALPQGAAMWFRSAIFLVYPVMLWFVQGLTTTLDPQRLGYKAVAIKGVALASLLLITSLSAIYLVTGPENAFPLFGQYNAYLVYLPSSMVQNSVPIDDARQVVRALEWVQTQGNSTLVIPKPFWGYGKLILTGTTVSVIYLDFPTLPVSPRDQNNEVLLKRVMDDIVQGAPTNGRADVRFIWWISGTGWYGVTWLDPRFHLIFAAGDIAIYSYQ